MVWETVKDSFFNLQTGQQFLIGKGVRRHRKRKKEDEICTSSLSSSTIPLTSGIEEAPQLLLSVFLFYHNSPANGNKIFLRGLSGAAHVVESGPAVAGSSFQLLRHARASSLSIPSSEMVTAMITGPMKRPRNPKARTPPNTEKNMSSVCI